MLPNSVLAGSIAISEWVSVDSCSSKKILVTGGYDVSFFSLDFMHYIQLGFKSFSIG